MKPKNTNSSNDSELSSLFITEEGTLSILYLKPVEIVGLISTPFGDGWNCKIK